MKVVCVSGARGSGKTSLIRGLVAGIDGLGKRAAVIVNEQGEVAYDPAFIEAYALQVRTVRGG